MQNHPANTLRLSNSFKFTSYLSIRADHLSGTHRNLNLHPLSALWQVLGKMDREASCITVWMDPPDSTLERKTCGCGDGSIH